MSTTRDNSKEPRTEPSAAYPVAALLRLTFLRLFRMKAGLLFAAMLLLPVAFSIYWSLAERMVGDALVLWGQIIIVGYLNFVAPFAALLYGTVLVSAETEARTLTYLVTRPVPRWLVVLVKYAAAAVVCVVGVTLSLLMTYSMLTLHFGPGPLLTESPYWLRLAGVMCLTVLVYLAVFLFAGMKLRRPVVFGLVLIVVWDGLVGLIPGIIRFATPAHYVRSLAIHATRKATLLAGLVTVKEAPVSVSLIVLASLWAVMLMLSVWWFTRAEFHTNPDRK